MKRFALVALMLAMVLTSVVAASAGPLPGAIFTTLVDGSRVNANIYQAKEEVYLDGGPGNQAPSSAAALPEGDYYFQVTDPSGKTLLSEDSVECRRFYVNEFGVIASVYISEVTMKIKGQMTTFECTHLTGVDQDHADLGAITVQLMPYKNTPNKGGVYKVWVTPVDQYAPGQGFHGFIPSWSKTDNFKIKQRRDFEPPVVNVKKFYDANANGVWDDGELELPDWLVDVSDPLGSSNTYFTPFSVMAVPSGNWTFTEGLPSGWQQTVVYVDGVAQPLSQTVTVNVAGAYGEVHEVVYGNVCVGYADFNTKGFWHNKNGLVLIQPEWIDYVNGLAPYAGNPFDGLDSYGDPVPTAKGPAGEDIAAEGTALAEISAYLVDSNAGGDPKIQLGQQLLAFIFNVKYTGVEVILDPNGSMSTQAMIDSAVAAWNEGGEAAKYWSGVLDGWNNSDAVPYPKPEPCPYSF